MAKKMGKTLGLLELAQSSSGNVETVTENVQTTMRVNGSTIEIYSRIPLSRAIVAALKGEDLKSKDQGFTSVKALPVSFEYQVPADTDSELLKAAAGKKFRCNLTATVAPPKLSSLQLAVAPIEAPAK